MIGKGLLIFLAVLAMAHGSADECESQSTAGCGSCLEFGDVTILSAKPKKGDRKKSKCAWFVDFDNKPRCIDRKRCDDKGFEGGKCHIGRKNNSKFNTKKCRRSKPKRGQCQKKKGCGKCLDNKHGCAYFAIGKALPRCIPEEKCGTKGYEGGTCTKGSETTDTEETCDLIENGGGDVGFETCSDFSSTSGDACGTCLNQGCAWVDSMSLCADACNDPMVPADVGCSILPQKKRSLLRFDGPASKICYELNLDKKNNAICMAVSNADDGTCEKCVSTKIATPPGTVNITPPTCKYHPMGNGCLAVASGMMEPGITTCTSWPELLKKTADEGKEYLSNIYDSSELEIQVINPGDSYTEDVRFDRVRFFVTDSRIIKEIPTRG